MPKLSAGGFILDEDDDLETENIQISNENYMQGGFIPENDEIDHVKNNNENNKNNYLQGGFIPENDDNVVNSNDNNENNNENDENKDENSEIQEENENNDENQSKKKDNDTCIKCPSKVTNKTWFDTFGILVCGKCRYSDPDFDLITKTNAKQNYLLTDNDLRDLGFFKKESKNTKFTRRIQMKLFLQSQVEAKSYEKYGGAEQLEEEKKNKELRALERSIQRKEKRSRKDDILLPPKKKLKKDTHVHEWGPTKEDSEKDLKYRICQQCAFRDEWETF